MRDQKWFRPWKFFLSTMLILNINIWLGLELYPKFTQLYNPGPLLNFAYDLCWAVFPMVLLFPAAIILTCTRHRFPDFAQDFAILITVSSCMAVIFSALVIVASHFTGTIYLALVCTDVMILLTIVIDIFAKECHCDTPYEIKTTT